MERDRQLDDPEASPEMAAGDGNRPNGFLAQLLRNLPELVFGELTKVVRGLDGVEEGCGQRCSRLAFARDRI
jgi:hypothetical protein